MITYKRGGAIESYIYYKNYLSGAGNTKTTCPESVRRAEGKMYVYTFENTKIELN